MRLKLSALLRNLLCSAGREDFFEPDQPGGPDTSKAAVEEARRFAMGGPLAHHWVSATALALASVKRGSKPPCVDLGTRKLQSVNPRHACECCHGVLLCDVRGGGSPSLQHNHWTTQPADGTWAGTFDAVMTAFLSKVGAGLLLRSCATQCAARILLV
jgi:hypothetical protein